jgi:hypothetical protein
VSRSDYSYVLASRYLTSSSVELRGILRWIAFLVELGKGELGAVMAGALRLAGLSQSLLPLVSVEVALPNGYVPLGGLDEPQVMAGLGAGSALHVELRSAHSRPSSESEISAFPPVASLVHCPVELGSSLVVTGLSSSHSMCPSLLLFSLALLACVTASDVLFRRRWLVQLSA